MYYQPKYKSSRKGYKYNAQHLRERYNQIAKSVHDLEEIINANLNKVYKAKFGIKRDKRIKDIRLTRIGYVKILNVFEFLGNRAADDKKEEVEVFIKALSKEYENFVM